MVVEKAVEVVEEGVAAMNPTQVVTAQRYPQLRNPIEDHLEASRPSLKW